ncbi:MAG: hypothetical protein SXG53_16035 [Pseudomonadota bacterium]|nr:hypothetical protein [Pseudomonadota bacterium]
MAFESAGEHNRQSSFSSLRSSNAVLVPMKRLICFVSLGAFVLLTGCGSADQREIEAMVTDRMGSVTSISDPVIFREGDDKKTCVVVNYANNWGEAMPPVMFVGWYHFQQGKWITDKPFEIEESFDCAAYAAERGEILEG